MEKYEKALKIKSDWAYLFAEGKGEEAIAALGQAINLSPDECRNLAKTDADFDSIRGDERFEKLINL